MHLIYKQDETFSWPLNIVQKLAMRSYTWSFQSCAWMKRYAYAMNDAYRTGCSKTLWDLYFLILSLMEWTASL